ncbi:membrane protein [Marivirga tractuosa]|uniref:Transmembrane protein n=1 Tax=Marivirga tractuosa (strain ATCC 23168 / DSM 4126 / NBRC 15989 / NCIMB 1408 / VKM B-1430 / H-43) TaxID=643867 RepID=E4TQX0_MARTH|nr:DUF4389 domain-containing protein [Marivirga tractuosa]ADR21670.1 putative transmembrane protein [Marivirga tractuosa DSM 4126]BDD13873.1 membrane protein [Marivirga tractuosa]
MLTFDIKHQDRYSRGELLLRSFFGWLYIQIPHLFLLFFVGLWGAILRFISFFIVLFTGRYPESFFEFQVQLIRWQTRLNARIFNLADDYPPFGLDAKDEYIAVDVKYPERISRGLVLLRAFFGIIYVLIPHAFVLFFRLIWCQILVIIAWWVVLFTGEFPKSWHEFIVGTLRWQTRVNLYMWYMTDEYPPFTGKPLAQ